MGYTAPLAPQSLNRSIFLPEERLTYQDVRQQPALLTIAYAWCLQHLVEKHNPPKNPDFHPWAERVRSCNKQCENLWLLATRMLCKIWRWKAWNQSLTTKTTIFSWVLATPVDELKNVEIPSHSVSPLAEDEAIWCTFPPPEFEQSNRYMLVVTSSVGWLNLGPEGDHARRSLSGGNVFQNPQMSAVFPPPQEVIHYRGATLNRACWIEDVTGSEQIILS